MILKHSVATTGKNEGKNRKVSRSKFHTLRGCGIVLFKLFFAAETESHIPHFEKVVLLDPR